VAFIVDVFAQMIVAWNDATTKQTDLVMVKRPRLGGSSQSGVLLGPESAGLE
jgi:hypothetical protein